MAIVTSAPAWLARPFSLVAATHQRTQTGNIVLQVDHQCREFGQGVEVALECADLACSSIFMARLVVGRTPLIVRKDGMNGYRIDDGCAGEKFQRVLKSRQTDPT